MRRLVGDPWFYPMLFVAGGLTFAVWGSLHQNVPVIAAALVILWFAWRYRTFTRVRSRPVAGAAAHVEAGGVVVFWRPGCEQCRLLLKELSPERRDAAYWVNIWTEPEGAAALRRLHAAWEGREHEAVPTAWARRKDFVVADDASRARLTDMLDHARRRSGAEAEEAGA